tara:strand:- start:1182 stop:1664 length:483 start_codon:yes stop_codon:yes gene_type:complete
MLSNLDILTDDNMDMILGFVVDSVENELELLETKFRSLNKLIELLSIKKIEDDNEDIKIYDITYSSISYCIKNYLFSRFIDYCPVIFIIFFRGFHVISDIMFNPTYFDILTQANLSIHITKNFYHCSFEGLGYIPHKKLKKYIGIIPYTGINYYEIYLRS